MKSYSHHILLCTGSDCKKKAEKIDKPLKKALSAFNRDTPGCRALRTKSGCLGICKKGPIMVVYPDGVWYHRVNKDVLQRIVDEHLRDGQPVTEYTIHQMGGAPAGGD